MIRNPNDIQDGAKKIRMLIAGYPGIGKSTLALSAPRPLHIDCDFGIDRIEPRYRMSAYTRGLTSPLAAWQIRSCATGKRRLMQHLTRSGNMAPTVAAGMKPTAGCPRRWVLRSNPRTLECSMWTSAARWSASCEKKGTNYGKRNCFERPYSDDFHFC